MAGACQAFLNNDSNYDLDTSCELLQWSSNAAPQWTVLDGAALRTYFDPTSPPSSARVSRVFFVTLEDCKDASYGCRLSLGKQSAGQLLELFNVNPHFCQSMFGKPDHWAPLDHRYTNDAAHEILEFVSQYQR
ncbi:uncharacterized protein HMPREF1541_03446 [Cyphellophora europaea CBS 101466]|uniref:Uncharacterized protein n=1 Tax=Cyphellophora europaea (strain CBS 101466) TaxID=1220924 RepID=W2RYV5_CYPE1|nr:uncharacterized protein HMPREF1541_03446 [Cyphellophora europaea CBS 101466]ETN41510.1 hypothetical protein HMPREF1541_03446 [Cyphellophora europaea CBS 101466]